MGHDHVEEEIRLKAKKWIDEYGADFLVELIDVYLEDTPNRLAQLRRALAGGDIESLIREAHTLKSSSANVGAMAFSAVAKEIEAAARAGKVDKIDDQARQIQEDFQPVKMTLEALRKAAADNNREL